MEEFKKGDIVVCGWSNEIGSCEWICEVDEYEEMVFFTAKNGMYTKYDGNVKIDEEDTWTESSVCDAQEWIRLANDEELAEYRKHFKEEPKEEDKDIVVRITFRSEVFLKGKSIDDIREQWEGMPIFSADAIEDYSAEVVDVVSVEDAINFDDLTDVF